MRTQAESSPSMELTPLNRIRVETALSRFPIHRLAKKGNISIDLAGDTDFQWKVSYNNEYGQPGPHAYKVDTLIINRRIDEAARPLPEMIRIRSLREINRELDLAEEDTQTIKKALLQNASAFISAKIRFKLKNARDGRERWREIHYTRYSVIFNGEALPDGRIADAVYIILNPPHRKMLNDAEVRPLDYDYLTELKPGPQRLYELLSFQVYGALASGRARAKLLYSDYCMCAPQVRYLNFNALKKQMHKLHSPHRVAGYIVKVDYQETTDREGKPDWEMLYTPGPKAITEYQAFANRQIRALSSAQPVSAVLVPPAKTQQRPIQTTFDLSEADTTLSELTRRGITEKNARELVANLKPSQELMDQLEYLDQIIAQAPRGKFHNPSGFYVKFIEDNASVPDTFCSSRKQSLHEETQKSKNAERARQAQIEIAYEEYQTAEVKRFISENLPAQEYRFLFEQCRQANRRRFKNMTVAQLDELTHTSVYAEVTQRGQVAMLSFEEFCRQKNATIPNR